MVGRTPEYLGKKIEAYEMKMASLAVLVLPWSCWWAPPLAVTTEARTGVAPTPVRTASAGPVCLHLGGQQQRQRLRRAGRQHPFYNLPGGLAMFVARFWLMIPVLAIAGSLAAKKFVPASPGTLPTHTPLFVDALIAVVVIVGALTFIPALALGPIVEHLIMCAWEAEGLDNASHDPRPDRDRCSIRRLSDRPSSIRSASSTRGSDAATP